VLNLINLCKKEKKNVPSFVDEIISVIESKGLDVDGLYRISGNLSEVQKVRHQVDHGKHNFKDFDIHVLCGALKTFFRELDEPLIPYTFHQHLINSTSKIKFLIVIIRFCLNLVCVLIPTFIIKLFKIEANDLTTYTS
jgi:hypothetical protein